MKSTRWFWASIAVAVGGALLRFSRILEPLSSAEAQNMETSALPIGSLLKRTALAEQRPPLYPMLLSGWQSLFGDGDAAARSLSGLFAAGILALLVLRVRRNSESWSPFFAIVLTAFSTFHLSLSLEVQQFSLFGFSFLWWLYAYDSFLRSDRPSLGQTATLGIAQAMLCAVDYNNVIPVIIACVLFFVGKARPLEQIYRFCLAQVPSYVLAGLWMPIFLAQLVHIPGAPEHGFHGPSQLIQAMLAIGPAPVHASHVVACAAGFVFLGLLLLGLLSTLRGDWSKGRTIEAPRQARVAIKAETGTFILLAGLAVVLSPYALVHTLDWPPYATRLFQEELTSSAVIMGIAVSALVCASFLNLRGFHLYRRLDPEVMIVLGVLFCYILMSFTDHKPMVESLFFILPLVYIFVAKAYVPQKVTTGLAVLALTLSIAAPSLLRERQEFRPRPDFRAAAASVLAVPEKNRETYIFPMWDRPGLERYTGSGSVTGILNLASLRVHAHKSDVVFLVLTREAFRRKEGLAASAAAVLEATHDMVGIREAESIATVQFIMRKGRK